MTVTQVMGDLGRLRLACYQRRVALAWPAKLLLAFGMAALTGLAAQVRIPLPFTPVPITGQLFAVLLSGALLGGAWGGISQVLYVGLGAVGVPWFSGLAGGMPLGPTAGYLMGFIPAAALIGAVSDRFVFTRYFGPQVTLMMLAVAVDYVCGAVGFMFLTGMGFHDALLLGVLPFVVFDLGKALAAAAVAWVVLPKGEANRAAED